jgi:dynein heavy chain
MYLETKRQIFPRFYFISNDDLLEILGQSKNPPAVQPHFKKLFDNIKSLKMTKSQIGGKIDASSMFSSEGEEVAFSNPLSLEGPVEVIGLKPSLAHTRTQTNFFFFSLFFYQGLVV